MRLFGAFILGLMAVSPLAAEVTRGEIEGAKYMIATPEKWQGKLVLIAHGYRPEGQPLDGNFEVANRFGEGLLEKGWAIAGTSYRRNGWIVEDAILDLKALRDLVVKEHGKVERCIVIGSSMGGLIGTLIAEGAMDGVDGGVLIGAYLGDRETEGFYKTLSYRPKIPVLHLTNETELEHPRHYRKEAGGEKTALWEIKRPGHCNVADIERLNGVLAVNDWIDGKAIEKERDGTVPPPVRASTARKAGEGLVGKVTLVSESWGNVSTDLVAKDFEALGLKPGKTAVLQHGGKKVEASVVRYWSEAAEGKAGVYVTAAGWVAIVINGGNAAEALGVTAGEEVRISGK
jgi:hypothetical protein